MRVLPRLVTKLITHSNAWVVGSAAEATADLRNVRDFDILVPFAEWAGAAAFIPLDAKPNCFGGWEVMEEGRKIEVWPGDLSWFLMNSMAKHIWQPRFGVRYSKV